MQERGEMQNPERGNIASGASDNKATKKLVESKYLYDPDTGFFHRRLAGGRIKQKKSGSINSNGYRQISVCRTLHSAHRLAWLVMTGEWPSLDVDHINGIRDDNRWVNLRLATRSTNMQNQRAAHSTSMSGLLGAHYHRGMGKFAAVIVVDGRKIHIGYFASANEAHAAYVAKKRQIHQGSQL